MVNSLPTTNNTPQEIADILRRDILLGRLEANQPLRQDDLAEQFGVSKTPVREALVQLQTEGLVIFRQNRGAFVTQLSRADIHELYLMRGALETLALRYAIPHMTTADLVQAEGILNQIDVIDPIHQLHDWATLNWQFHHLLYAPSGFHMLINTARIWHINVVRYLLATPRPNNADFLATSQTEHRQLITLCRAGQIDTAVQTLAQHLATADNLIE